MGNRLSKIYTRTGDDGTTGLGNGERVAKDSLRIETIGAVDELNCAIGRVLVHDLRDAMRECLQAVQHKLFDLGGELSIPGYQAIKGEDVERLESALNDFNAQLPPLKEFILPGGGRAAADCHMARAICRRAERRLVSLASEEDVGEHARRYLNRLSDLLFVLCRILARDEGGVEVLWRNPARSSNAT
ncbi:MAG: cob(I)yrinic acid a,c-diamide adenosyltransferase [Candidatus Competibacteraceae bacterium]|nr:cob(I)yrinic acid a,c-diamide adenosyltransferase [Candidatus Competibacteraceae bacterium]MBK7983026.1 cob(I)yrinic acid a,c-diamide adenosyltransferase [Candidatus Competibacteraceae bacterium]MBK8898422.1 cob(I)yrinic acid a,c-diamide adenosyltransferase [Candidatus Competibacteraceae bacterium]MBK8962232.1 cob(I)yrinic acid a,c-diamide adenosyltransferase [Candidatus Competibacteraceae bacterium]